MISIGLGAGIIEQVVAPFIDGRLSQSLSDASIPVVNPSNGQPLATIPAGCEADVDHAVISSRHAFDDGRWSEVPPSVRKRVLHGFADLIAENSAALDALDAGEMGKPVSETFSNAAASAGLMRFYAESLDKINGSVFSSDKTSLVVHRREPRGVVAAVVPWNFPTFVIVLKLAPALAAGNCVILKPSELASRSAMLLADLAIKAGLPPGVLNVVPGVGETVGRALGLHMNVDMVSFTGSSEVGKLMLQYAGQSNMKVVMAECGGKSPQIVFDDGVDLDAAADAIAKLIMVNQGQLCGTGSRLLVQRSIESKMVERVVANFKRIAMGDALDPKTTFGPLASAQQCARVERYIQSARPDGAELVVGGRRVLTDTGGYFVEPTLFRNVPLTARIAREEIFGPVLSVIPFADEAEAIRIANGTMYGLLGFVWTADLSTGMRMAKSIRSPVFVNGAAPSGEGVGHGISLEPFGQSGVGPEGGLPGMESYLRRHFICFNHA